MPRDHLKDRTVANAKLPEPPKKYIEYWDTLLPGFGLRVNAGGKRTFMLFIRVNGKQRRQTLGTYPALSLTEARALARERMDEADRGIDRNRQKVLERHAAARRQAATFEVAAAHFIEDYAKAKGLRTWHLMERDILEIFNPVWGALPVAEITRDDIKDLLREKARTAPIRSNRLLALIRKLLNWCVDEGLIETNPASRIVPYGKIQERDRVLSDPEKVLFWNSTGELGEPYASMLKVLALTAQRIGEVSGMRWAELDLAKGEWLIPRERAKRGVANLVPLSPEAVAIIDALPRMNDCVFTSGRAGNRPLSGFSKCKVRIDRLMPDVEPWIFHDLRRTAATAMRELGHDRLTVSGILNHAEVGTTKIYDRYGMAAEKRAALEGWARHLIRLADGDETSNVVELAGAER